MMRKLALTVFAMSLTLAGCGSSSSNKKPDAASDAQIAADGSKDVSTPDTLAPKLDTGVTADTQVADVAVDTSVDAARQPDVSADVVTVADARDGAVADRQSDTRLPDTGVIKLDAAADAPADTAPVQGDAGGDAQVD